LNRPPMRFRRRMYRFRFLNLSWGDDDPGPDRVKKRVTVAYAPDGKLQNLLNPSGAVGGQDAPLEQSPPFLGAAGADPAFVDAEQVRVGRERRVLADVAQH